MVRVNDPTRIPRVLEAVRNAWEGQPDLTFGAIVGIFENHGLSWASTDGEAENIALNIAAQHPPRLTRHMLEDASFTVRVAPNSTVKGMQYTISRDHVVVDRGPSAVLAAWRHTGIVQSTVGGPLKIRDVNGNVQRCGIIELISKNSPVTDRALVMCADGSEVDLQFPHATVVVRGRRATDIDTYRLSRRPDVREGEPLRLELASDKSDSQVELGVVERVMHVG